MRFPSEKVRIVVDDVVKLHPDATATEIVEIALPLLRSPRKHK
jgi:hypothetical protein